MQGEFVRGELMWWWYDSLLALPALVISVFFTYKVLVRAPWTRRNMLIAKGLSLLATALVLLVVLDRVGALNIPIDGYVYGFLSLLGAGMAVVLGAGIMFMTRGGRLSGPSDVLLDRASAGARQGGAPQAPAGATMMLNRVPTFNAWLLVRTGGEQGKTYELKGDRVTIGRSSDSTIRVDHPSVDPSHVLIRVGEGRYQMYDMGSSTGTWLNGNAVMGAFLPDGSRITMGTSELFYSKMAATSPSTQEAPPGSQGMVLVRSGPNSGKGFPVGDEDLVIGRQPGPGGAQLDDPSVSGRHALLRPTPHGTVIYDLGSANGTSINDIALAGSLLQNGDVLKLGEAELQFVQEESP